MATSISYFLTAATKLSCCSSNKKVSRWPGAYSLFFSVLLTLFFQICGYAINLSLILQTTWIQKQFLLSFSSLLTLLLSVLYKTWMAMRFPAKITSSCIWVAIPVNWVILHWYACGADRRSVAWAVGGCMVTWLTNFLKWVDLLSYGAPPTCAPEVCSWNSAKNLSNWISET